MVSVWQSFMIALARSGSLTRFRAAQSRIHRPRASSSAARMRLGASHRARLETAGHTRIVVLPRRVHHGSGNYAPDGRQPAAASPGVGRHGLDTHVSGGSHPDRLCHSARARRGERPAPGRIFPGANHSTRSFLMIDMEDASYVDLHHRAAQPSGKVAAFRPPSRCRPTCGDRIGLGKVFLRDRVPCVRLVKGAFSEPGGIAWTHSAEISGRVLAIGGGHAVGPGA